MHAQTPAMDSEAMNLKPLNRVGKNREKSFTWVYDACFYEFVKKEPLSVHQLPVVRCSKMFCELLSGRMHISEG